ncbi:hypothetical protein FA10DRAFT_268106 [Acaromyces ingoldii]|uniref:Uncharacterized protein n=1 Tax=Acaromyces ingoldii TaxID=215250 RepID=A0A316YKH7_9BASI|nr:hypothetical protein FA10DRAFT_268106 [Acaromyces ingoldii]PWN89576.1 hypothetical protein FA10DRAFT_268106 [Acaromyces ingoldii]
MSSALPLLSPLVTRILELSGFPPELKTRDIQAIFAQWEDDRGGFRIKWVDDTTALVIFADPAPAKRAYLHVLMSPPPSLMTSAGVPAKVRPYDGDDAAQVISSVQNRPRSRSNAGGNAHATPAYGASADANGNGNGSGSGFNGDLPATPARNLMGSTNSPRSTGRSLAGLGHRRTGSGSNPSSLPPKPLAAALFDAANGGPSPAHHLANAVAAEQQEREAASLSASPSKKPLNLPVNPMLSAQSSVSPSLQPSPDIENGAAAKVAA